MKLKFKWKIIFGIIIFILLLIVSTTYIANTGIKVREYKIKNDNIPIYGLKIVQFSDLYYGKSMNLNKLNDLIDKINKTKPDIVIFSGDLVDKNTKINTNLINDLKECLSKIDATYGKYYVNGDIDSYNKSFDSIMEDSNFTKLNNSINSVYSKNGNILITGIDIDNTINEETIENINSENYKYKIFVSHYPDSITDGLKYNYDLILASHSLNGQIRLPSGTGIFRFDNAKTYYNEYYKVNNSDIYITGGIGNKVLNIRLFNKPSFNLYRLVN